MSCVIFCSVFRIIAVLPAKKSPLHSGYLGVQTCIHSAACKWHIHTEVGMPLAVIASRQVRNTFLSLFKCKLHKEQMKHSSKPLLQPSFSLPHVQQPTVAYVLTLQLYDVSQSVIFLPRGNVLH